MLFVSGTGPNNVDGKPVYTGKLGAELSLEEGYKAARLCGINMLATVREYIGDLDRVAGIMKVFGLVASSPDFYDQPAVMHGFSDLMAEALGDRGIPLSPKASAIRSGVKEDMLWMQKKRL